MTVGKPDRTKLLTVIDDAGAVQLYFGRSLDDHTLDYGGEFLFHRDGTVTFMSRTDDDTAIVTTIFRNRVVVAITEHQVGVTEDRDFPLGEVLCDTNTHAATHDERADAHMLDTAAIRRIIRAVRQERPDDLRVIEHGAHEETAATLRHIANLLHAAADDLANEDTAPDAAPAATVLYRCERDRNGCGHEWRASDAGDVFLTCPACGKSAGAIV